MTDRIIDAYRMPRKVVDGCMHRLGCKCEPPFWLRGFSPAELERLKRDEAKQVSADAEAK